MKFLVIHGSFGSPEGNWFPSLKKKVELLNQDIFVPGFPINNWEKLTKQGELYKQPKQTLTNWLKVFKSEVLPWAGDEKVVIIAHSLGPVFILHALSKYKLNVDAAIFVSPFFDLDTSVGAWQVHFANRTFYKTDFDFKKLRRVIPVSYVLYSENDPYVNPKYAKTFAEKLHSSTILVRGAKHMNSEVNLNEFPLVLELAKSRVDLTIYQKYLAYLNECHPLDYIKQAQGGSMTIPYSNRLAAEEAIFHFRNLEKSGFCTLAMENVSKLATEQSVYMQEGRKAAKRGVPIDRVYILNDKENIKNEIVLDTMQKDANAGIGVYYLFRDEIDIPEDRIDFGIWDNSYVVTLTNDKGETMVNMDSTKKRLKEANEHKKIIMKKARKWINKTDT